MLVFTFAFSCLTTSNLPWLMDLTFQGPMQYCSLQHWTVLSPSDTSTTEHHFHFGPTSSFFLKLLVVALCSSPEVHWTPSDLGRSSFHVTFSCLFMLFLCFLRQEYWSGLPFPPLVDHVLSELSTMTRPSWVALHDMAQSFIQLHKPLHQDKAVFHDGNINKAVIS